MRISEQILLVTVITTRRCNLHCPYCGLWRCDYYVKPAFTEEKDWDYWFEVARKLDDIGAGIACFLGGEPLLTRGNIVRFVEKMNDLDLYYAIQSNSTLLTIQLAKALLDAGIRNWSTSVDTLILKGDRISEKSASGYRWMKWFQEHGVKDVVATVVTTKFNQYEVLELIKRLDREDIWVLYSVVDWKRGKHYDFASLDERAVKPWIPDAKVVEKISEELKLMKANGAHLHDPIEYFSLLPKYVEKPYFCLRPWAALTIDADGRLRLCYRIRGYHVPKFTVFDLGYKDGEIYEAFVKDYKYFCRGCNWECVITTDIWTDKYDWEESVKSVRHFN